MNDYHPYLKDILFQHLRDGYLAYTRKEHFASAVWGSVFLEAFLGELARELGIPSRGQDDLNGRIQQLQSYS